MSQTVKDLVDAPMAVEPADQKLTIPTSASKAPSPGSLRDRMQRRREELEARTTEKFHVPLWDEFCAVELRAISWETSEQAITANQRVPRFQMLNTAGSEIVKATVAFHEIKDDGSLEVIDDVRTWRDLATGLAGKQLPEGCSERVALISMCTDQGVLALNGLYRRWLGGADVGITAELRTDF